MRLTEENASMLFSTYNVLYAELAMIEDPEMLQQHWKSHDTFLVSAALVLSLIQMFIFVKQIILFELMLTKSWDIYTYLIYCRLVNQCAQRGLFECEARRLCLVLFMPRTGLCRPRRWEVSQNRGCLAQTLPTTAAALQGRYSLHQTWIVLWGCLGGENYKLTQRVNE